MFTVAFIFRRKPGLSRMDFDALYEAHREVMTREARGLISYVQHKTLPATTVGGIPCDSGYDALSIYTYRSEEDAAFTTRLETVAADSERFIDFSSMVTLAVSAHTVYQAE
ncbi:EthD domain-containing protein [Pseudomonas sp. Marseille-P9899]|uniref:EthD domain-containing protein n=1 Tax=Pseudomonas sp. Marseille-P9899 TaxID=2730401 RepID=UPI001589F371|nr:EthD domain-containing protein [Pseudomonas sp. Marseille-P9899]